jgi:hypothetical protein
MVGISMGKKGLYVKASGARQVCLLCPLDPGSGSHFFADAMNRGQSFALFSLITNSFFFVAKFRVCGIEIALGDWVRAPSLQLSSCFSLLKLFLGGFWQRFLFYWPRVLALCSSAFGILTHFAAVIASLICGFVDGCWKLVLWKKNWGNCLGFFVVSFVCVFSSVFFCCAWLGYLVFCKRGIVGKRGFGEQLAILLWWRTCVFALSVFLLCLFWPEGIKNG